jgi:hypothetical protein
VEVEVEVEWRWSRGGVMNEIVMELEWKMLMELEKEILNLGTLL